MGGYKLHMGSHMPEHKPDAPVCSCGMPAEKHRKRDRSGRDQSGRDQSGRDQSDRDQSGRYKRGSSKPRKREYVRHSMNDNKIVAIDGEGQGRAPHLYTYLAAVDEDGDVKGEIENENGLQTKECFEFFLDLGVTRVFGFSLGYDLTKILVNLPDRLLYELNRPDVRKYVSRATGRESHKAIYWKGYKLSYMRGKLGIQRAKWNSAKHRYVGEGRSVILWDVFRFFQSKFVTALLDWKIAPPEKLERMRKMKDERGEFDKLLKAGKISKKDIQDYCKEECEYLAKLVCELIEAHKNVNLDLKVFYGAGSTATCLLKNLGIKEYLEKPPPEMRQALACGFFGGRFEISRSGPVDGKVYNYDISSAYPYQTAFLPCLKCGKWEHVTSKKTLRRRIEQGRLALVHALPRRSEASPDAWGPLPWRSPDGTILFPQSSGGVWVWKEEFLTAQRIFPGIEATEAWIYETPCAHKPFEALPEMYRERLQIGKEGRGIVLKLGTNSVYGKTAQSIGQAPFQSYVWAGVITSNTRAQLLSCFESVKDWWSILMFATDGIFSREPLTFPTPKDTNTWEIVGPDGKVIKKPLGGWEEKVYKKGIFLLRPGIYFPLQATEDEIKDVKARGMSKGVLLDNVDRIQEHWRTTRGSKHFEVNGVQRFVGMVTGVLKHSKSKPAKRNENYGEWIDYPIQASFIPGPKRHRMLPDNSLTMFEHMPGDSSPYRKANKAPETVALREAEAILMDQADGDFAEGIIGSGDAT